MEAKILLLIGFSVVQSDTSLPSSDLLEGVLIHNKRRLKMVSLGLPAEQLEVMGVAPMNVI